MQVQTDAGSPPRPGSMEIQVISGNRIIAGGTQVALGLLWQPAGADLALRDQARLAGGGQGEFDLYARPAGLKQVGFGSTRDGLSPGNTAGATAIASSGWGDNWLAAIPLPCVDDLWWIVAMRDSLIYEDQVFSGEEPASAAMTRSLEAPDWDKVMAPDSWMIEAAEQADLVDVLDLRTAVRLRRVNWVTKVLTAVAGTVAFAVAVAFGWSEWSRHQPAIIPPSTFQQEAAVPVSDHPWTGSPRIQEFAAACFDVMEELAVMPPGWPLESLTCSWIGTRATAAAIWSSLGGSPAMLRAATADIEGGDVALNAKGNKAELSLPVELGPPEDRTDEEAWSLHFLNSVVRERFSSLGLEANIVSRTGKTDRKTGLAFDRIDLGLKTSAAILEYVALISDLPGLVPEALVYRPAANVWHLTSRAYSRPRFERRTR